MEGSARHGRSPHLYSSVLLKQRRSGYEPSDTETEWQESPWHDHNQTNEAGDLNMVSDLPRNIKISPMRLRQRKSSMFEYQDGSSAGNKDSRIGPTQRRASSKSPYKPRRDDGIDLLLKPSLDVNRNIRPLSKFERRRYISPFKSERVDKEVDANGVKDDVLVSNRWQNQKTPARNERESNSQLHGVSKVSESLSYNRRSVTAPRLRKWEMDQQKLQNSNGNQVKRRGERTPSPLARNIMGKHGEVSQPAKSPSVGELNEMVANSKMSIGPLFDVANIESTESISPGDIFFSHDHTALAMQKNSMLNKTGSDSHFLPEPPAFSQKKFISHPQAGKVNGSLDQKTRRVNSMNSGFSQTTMTSSSNISRQSSKLSSRSSKASEVSGRTSVSMGKFTANRRKSQTDTWFACMRKGACRTPKSPDRTAIDETNFIEKAFVVEELGPFWADKHQPGSLNGFICHKQEAQLLKQLVSRESCPHILFKGPSGSGKRALAMALLHEIYGDQCWNVSHELRFFPVQEKRPIQVPVPITSSTRHMELNVKLEPNAKYALMGLVKEINSRYAIPPEVSNASLKADYKVIVLYEVDKAEENIQHLIKLIVDRYTDVCKLILCCEDDANIIEPVRNLCTIIKVDAPITHEIMEILIQIARKEDIDLPMSFAAKIATKSKQNLRKAIMALEACKANNYPFVDDQPIQLGWEEVLIEIAAEILADPSPKRLFFLRGKFQTLLVDFVHPKLILQKLVEQFLKGIEASLKREVFYWHAYYEKRLPAGTTALLKLEEFVAKFMSIYRKSSRNRQFV
ncbi:uncharacterized protein LOC110822243 isoform X1 [Carica papaya]|uniref:uncharacterized protein LOC110822243 isoform X1 n=1 Tax=Carica papaya TaxID=3649 RepID=UPI000B8CF5E0|nr:uncharacterized protein LOC110822243 isoform X1 [Carica papaya]XP_021907992.1 uncharacterized protein LOC110822243 isoform X1 [Carica papaya]